MALEPENRPQSMQEWLVFLHPPQPKKQQQESPKSSWQSRPKKYKNQLDYSTWPFIRLSFLLLLYVLLGTLFMLSNAGVLAVAGAVTFEFLKKRYNCWLTLLILGTTSTLDLVLGSILGWFLKLQGVSLPSWFSPQLFYLSTLLIQILNNYLSFL